ncbi:hypothetical protein BDW69DRAFT_164757 [Aspergillus filifer]
MRCLRPECKGQPTTFPKEKLRAYLNSSSHRSRRSKRRLGAGRLERGDEGFENCAYVTRTLVAFFSFLFSSLRNLLTSLFPCSPSAMV